MFLFDEIIIKDSIEINTSAEKIWNFFDNLEENYLKWHPSDHVYCKWVKGKPHEVGSIAYFEQRLEGRLVKVKTKTTEIVKYEYSENKPLFPFSIFHPKGEHIITRNEGKCIFTAINYFRVPRLFKKTFLKRAKFEALKKHMKDEGEVLKKIIENRL